MKSKCVIVLDCGATNVRAVAIDQSGSIKAIKSVSNNTAEDSFLTGGRIWEINSIKKKLYKAIKEILYLLPKHIEIIGVTITTFGVDGAPFDKEGNQIFPVISWACQRTVQVMNNINKYINNLTLYKKSGIYPFSFNTIYKLIWLQENHPEILKKADKWLFMPSIISFHLSGKMITDVSMAGTSMLTDLKTREFSNEILSSVNIKKSLFPPLKEAGSIIGGITKEAANECGLKTGLPVIAAGHDTQFAIFGSGAEVNEPVLSSGTWEILMVRTPEISVGSESFEAGITTEYDAIKGLYNAGIQWMGSGVLEWIRKTFYADIKKDENIYEIMIKEAEQIKASKLEFNPDFINGNGQIRNLSLTTKREEIYLAALIALVQKTKTSLNILEQNFDFKASSLIVVGGGSKNQLWNKLRSEILGIPLKVIEQTETTVLGAAMFAFAACGLYNSPEEARKEFAKNINIFEI